MRRLALVAAIVLAGGAARADFPVNADYRFQGHEADGLHDPATSKDPATAAFRLGDFPQGGTPCVLSAPGANGKPVCASPLAGLGVTDPISSTGGATPTLGLKFTNVSLTLSGGGALQRAALSGGDVTAPVDSNVLTIVANAVTVAKFQQLAARSVLANATGSIANATALASTTSGDALWNNAGTLTFAPYPYGSLSGSPTLHYQTVIGQTQEPAIDLGTASATGLSANDNSGVSTRFFNTLVTGLAGGQSIVGGTNAGNNLSLFSNNNGGANHFGFINFDGRSSYNAGNNAGTVGPLFQLSPWLGIYGGNIITGESAGLSIGGAGGPPGTSPIYVKVPQNGQQTIQIVNASTGALAQASVTATNSVGGEYGRLTQFGTNYATFGAEVANGVALEVSGLAGGPSHGLLINVDNASSGDIMFATNDVVRWAVTYNGALKGLERATPATPAATFGSIWISSADHNAEFINSSAVVTNMVQPVSLVAHKFLQAVDGTGTWTQTQPTTADISGLATGFLADPGANGIVVRTAAGTTTARTLATDGTVTITNPDAVAGAPSFARPAIGGAVVIAGGSNTATQGIGATTSLLGVAGSSAARADIACGGDGQVYWDNAGTVVCAALPYAKLSGTPSSLPPSGAAGGALTGTYPNPGVNVGAGAAVTGVLPLANFTPGTNGQVLTTSGGVATWATAAAGGITQLTGPVTAGPGSGSQATSIAANAITDAMLRQSGALSVMGRAANSTGNEADIQATAGAGGVLRESGSTIGFGNIAEAAVTNLVTDLAGKQATITWPTPTNALLISAGSGSTPTASANLTFASSILTLGTSGAGSIAIELNQAHAQGIDKTGGDFYFGTGDDHGLGFYQNNGTKLWVKPTTATIVTGTSQLYLGAPTPETQTIGNASLEFNVTPANAATAGTVQGIVEIDALTQTLTGTSTVANWGAVHVKIPTITDASAGTVTNAAALLLDGPPSCTGSLACTVTPTLRIKTGKLEIDALAGSNLVGVDANGALKAAVSSDVTTLVAWPTGVLVGASGALTNYSTTANRVLLGTAGGGVTDSSGLTYDGAQVTLSTASSNTAILLSRAGAQDINKHGGQLSVGTDDANLLDLYTNNAARLDIDASGNIRFNAYGAGVLETDGSGNVGKYATTNNRVLLGTNTSGVTDSANLTFAGGILQLGTNGTNSAAIGLTETGGQGINKHGGTLFIGTDDANLFAVYTNNVNHLEVSSAGGIRFNAYGAGGLSTDGSGNVTAAAWPAVQDVLWSSGTTSPPSGDTTFFFDSLGSKSVGVNNLVVNGVTAPTNTMLIVGHTTNSDRDRAQFFLGGGTLGPTGSGDSTLFDLIPSNISLNGHSVTGGIYATERIRPLSYTGGTIAVDAIQLAASLYIDAAPTVPIVTSLSGGPFSIYAASGQAHFGGSIDTNGSLTAHVIDASGTAGTAFHATGDTTVRIGFFGVTPQVQQAGGALTAGGTYTSNEQQMINKMYAALRAYGLIN